MTDPMEDIIARTMMTGDRETGDRQMSCNIAARTKVNCSCGDVLDQHDVVVVENHLGRIVAVYCSTCWPRVKHLWPEPKYDVITWDPVT